MLGSTSKCDQVKSFLQVLLWQMFFRTGLNGSTSFFSSFFLPFSTFYSDRLHDFSVAIPRRCKDVYANSFFPCTARPRNSLSIECFPLTYDLSGFKSRINSHLLTVVSF